MRYKAWSYEFNEWGLRLMVNELGLREDWGLSEGSKI